MFETVRHLILYDFAIHWFDFLSTVMGGTRPRRVYASMARSATQSVAPPLLAQAMVDYESGQATLIFDGFTRFDRMDRTLVVGSQGAIRSGGATTETQRVELTTAAGIARPRLKGTWFPDGFHGTMAELLSRSTRAQTKMAKLQRLSPNILVARSLCYQPTASPSLPQSGLSDSVSRLPWLMCGHGIGCHFLV